MARYGKDKIEGYYGFIYITTNLVNSKKYIGQKKFDHKSNSYIGSGQHFVNAVKKYGRENFNREILDYAKSPEELNILEFIHIRHHDAVKSAKYYNMIDGGKPTTAWECEKTKVIEIGSRKVFESLTLASYYFNTTPTSIKRSFNYSRKMLKDYPVFRPYVDSKKIVYCRFCGDLFERVGNKKTCDCCNKYYYGSKKDKQDFDSKFKGKMLKTLKDNIEKITIDNFEVKKSKVSKNKRCSQCGGVNTNKVRLCDECIRENTKR